MITSVTSFFVTFREGFEAVMLCMLMLGVGRSQGIKPGIIALGIALGLAASGVILALIGMLDMPGHAIGEVMNAATALVLTYVVLLNAKVSKHINEHMDQVRNRGFWAMLFTIATIFFREGTEVVLMLYGPMSSDPLPVLTGGALGFALLACLVWGVRRGTANLAVSPGKLFLASNIALGLLALYFWYETAEYVIEHGVPFLQH